MNRSIAVRGLGTLVLCVAVAGCASIAPVPYSEMASSAYMAPDKSDASGRVPYRYSTPVDWRTYSKVILDRVVIYRGRDHQFGDMSGKDKATLAAYMQNCFADRLRGRFVLVREPGPNTLRIRLTLTGAVANTPVLGTLSRFDMAGAVYNGVQAARDGEGMLTGSVVYGVEIFDATTSRLLSAYVTKQYPAAYDIKATTGALAAATAGLDKGADALMAQLN
ncbi:DUF3313 domain-containing protein [Bradyrhizobium liaoningense]|uniref:DUF3313 domain-containing protein n=1 Tax=Bradyrhizobium liaoningense TaxID=43992 RepID=UPI001BAC7AD9|nr:DUF3313 domain-containing protein [Bradyrhizobium liaoningense]MBR0984591.1 DUF3313 domain-containing protein [Bradyrhizobium liaoningense]